MGFVNGARGYIDSIQFSKETPTEVDVIWVIFKDRNMADPHIASWSHTFLLEACSLLAARIDGSP